MSKTRKIRIVCGVGARPNFVKIAPILRSLKRYSRLATRLVHTGQHYDRVMSEAFFEDLGIAPPDVFLGVGSGSHGLQTGKIMEKFEEFLLADPPELVLVVGDVNSTLACALAAVKLHIPVAHVEAGLRSYNREMPEEINRVLTDQISDFLFTTSRGAGENLLREGVDEKKIFFVGNTMIDSLRKSLPRAERRSRFLRELELAPGSYALLTLHRPEVVDSKERLEKALKALEGAAELLPVVYPVHPRTRKRFSELGLEKRFRGLSNLILSPPLGYLDFLHLMIRSRMVLTDSGGIQEETTVLGVPCLTLREETERPVTVEKGTNIVVGLDRGKIRRETEKILGGKGKKGKIPELWDGKAASRIARILSERLSKNSK